MKSVEAVSHVHYAQVISYLKLSGKSIGLLINFNVVHLKDGIKRFVQGIRVERRFVGSLMKRYPMGAFGAIICRGRFPMTLGRLVIVALLLCPLVAFSQDEQVQPSTGTTVSSTAIEKLSEPWRIIPPEISLNQNTNVLRFSPRAISSDDFVCLKIRSYVVARDSKDSDSVHPVKYSTCQPASRYQLKTTELHETVRQKDAK